MDQELAEALFWLVMAVVAAIAWFSANRVRTITTKPDFECPEGRECPYRVTYRIVPGQGIGMSANVGEAIAAGCCRFKKDLEAAKELYKTMRAMGKDVHLVGAPDDIYDDEIDWEKYGTVRPGSEE